MSENHEVMSVVMLYLFRRFEHSMVKTCSTLKAGRPSSLHASSEA